jgi:hypothetical protein
MIVEINSYEYGLGSIIWQIKQAEALISNIEA